MVVPWRTCLIFVAVQWTFRATSTAVNCPTNCTCDCAGYPACSSLTVDCLQAQPDIDRESFTKQLDSLLCSNLTYGRLSSLTIVDTPLSYVPRSVCRLTTLTQLRLDRNRLARLPDNCISNLTALTLLTASRNYITRLQDGLFDGLRNLVTLYVDDNRISSIGLRVFNSSSMLTGLGDVRLDGNRLTTLEPWPYFVGVKANRSHRAHINLSNNRISKFTNMMEWRPTCSMKPTYLHLGLSNNSIKHVSDIVYGWNLSFTTLMCLLVQSWQSMPSSHIIFTNNYLNCDCVDFSLYRAVFEFRGINNLDKTYCGKPGSLYGTRVTSVPLDQFVCELTERCPFRCRCVHRPANATLHVYCSNTNLTALPLEVPALPKSYTKYKLDFSNNPLLRRLEHRDYFVNTSILDVSNCGIEAVDNWKDVLSVKNVYLHGNRLTFLPRSVAALNVTTERVTLYKNPWRCSCEDRWMTNWLSSASQRVMSAEAVSCQLPTRLRGKRILEISDSEFCHDPVSEARSRAVVYNCLSVAGVAGVLLSVGLVVYRLRVRLYTNWKLHPLDRDECLGEDMEYDVFFCCSSEDHDPDGRTVVETLEANGYRVCYHYRDFMPGLIVDNIMASVTLSKRTVCLLTCSFIRRFVHVFYCQWLPITRVSVLRLQKLIHVCYIFCSRPRLKYYCMLYCILLYFMSVCNLTTICRSPTPHFWVCAPRGL